MVAILLLLLPVVVTAQDAAEKRSEIDGTIDRGLEFLVKDALLWKEEHKCASCHHAALVVCAMRDAKQFGRAIDEPVLADLMQGLAQSGNGKFGMARPPSAPAAASPKAMYFALALGTDPEPNDVTKEGFKLLLTTVKAEQTENGSWSTWPGTRPPIFGGSNESLTALATLALLPAAAAGDVEAKAALDRSVTWLTETKTDDDPQSIALRLVLWTRLKRPAEEWEPLVRRINDRQNADGGWSQTPEMASDGWASGQALYALSCAGRQPNQEAIARGQAFLVRTQRADGSWSMTSRPTAPGGPGSTSLIPITGAGSAWAVLGLVHSTQDAKIGAAPASDGK
jgi:hypothetical protein